MILQTVGKEQKVQVNEAMFCSWKSEFQLWLSYSLHDPEGYLNTLVPDFLICETDKWYLALLLLWGQENLFPETLLSPGT